MRSLIGCLQSGYVIIARTVVAHDQYWTHDNHCALLFGATGGAAGTDYGHDAAFAKPDIYEYLEERASLLRHTAFDLYQGRASNSCPRARKVFTDPTNMLLCSLFP